MSLVSVWPHKIQSGWDTGLDYRNKATGRTVPRFPLYDAREALQTTWTTDAHFVPYRIPGLDKGHTQPRINEAARREVLTPRGIEPVLDLVVIDVDAPKTVDDVETWSLERIDRVLDSDIEDGCGWYVTRGGFRLLWEVAGLPIKTYLDTLARVRAYLATLDVHADRLVDWNRCYRLPFVIRDGEPQDRPADLDSLGPLPDVPHVESVFDGIEQARTSSRFELPDAIVESVGDGRNRTLFRLASKMRDAGATLEELTAALVSINFARCKPPLDEREVESVARSAMRYEPNEIKAERAERPRVVVRPGELPELVEQSSSLLEGVDIYQRAGVLVAVDRDIDTKRGTSVEPGSPVIRELQADRLRVILASRGDWRRRKMQGEEAVEVPVDPPKDVVNALMSVARWPGVRPLVGVTETPTMRADGTILDVSGYDTKTGIVFSPPAGLVFPKVTRTDREESRRARHALEEVLTDFPFGGPAHRAVAVSAMLTAVGRFGIEGPTPLFLFDAHTPGAGKGLLADVVSVLCTGRRAPVLAIRDDTETEKRITAHLCSGKRVILLDNVAGAFGGPALDAALTADVWAGRVLGQSTLIEVPNRATWIATGNNVAIRGDLARRTLRAYLDVETERPEERSGFSHPDLIGYVRAHRGRLVSACLTLLRAYVDAGRPRLDLPPLGSFGEWSRSVRSAVVFAGMEDPCSTQTEIREGSDRDLDAWSTVLETWSALHSCARMTVPDILDDLSRQVFDSVVDEVSSEHRKALKEALTELAGGRGGELNPRRVGWVLAKHRSRIVGGRRLVRGDKGNAGRRWYVETLNRLREHSLS